MPDRRIWAIAVLGCISIIPVLIGPIITGVLVDYGGYSERAAGLTAGFGAIGSVSVALLCALTMHHLPLRTLARSGLVLAAASNVAAAFLYPQQELFYALRAVASFSDGACYAAVMSCFAREARSERCYGAFMMLQFGLAAVALYALPTYLPAMTVTQMYLGFAALNLAGLGLSAWLPGTAARAEGVSLQGSEWRLLLTLPALAGLVALCSFESSNVATDAYIERIALSTGLDNTEIGSSLGIASLMGVPGALAILWLGGRFGHTLPVLAGTGVGAASLYLTLSAGSYGSFLLWLSIHSASWAFTLPYIQSLLADLDPGGAVVTAGGLASGAGGGLGPSAVALLLSPGSYQAVLVVGLAAYGICALATLVAALAHRA